MIHVCIIGQGLIGGSLGMALRRVRSRGRRLYIVNGFDLSKKRLSLAKRTGAADQVSLSLTDSVSRADVVVLATPVQVMPGLVKKIVRTLKKGAILTDVGSVKELIGEEIRKGLNVRPDVKFVGGHPLAGSEKSGIENASAELFSGSFIVLTTDKVDKMALRQVAALWKSVGAQTLFLNSEHHDKTLALTSHLPHLISFALFSQANKTFHRNKSMHHFAAGSFRDMTRVAGSDAEVWAGIFSVNQVELKKSWRVFQSEVNRLLNLSGSALEKSLSSISISKRRWK